MSMSMEMKFQLTTALLKHGQVRLAEHLGISSTELSKKINGENGWKTDQFAAALEFVGQQLFDPETETKISNEELAALRTLAKKSLENE